jgi:tetratricopeptide (TPR) repeat protein
MHDAMRNPSESPARDELPAPLRAAVDQVQAQPLPFEAVSAALDRAKRLEATTMARPRKHGWRRAMAAAVTLAAALLGPMILASAWKQDSAGESEEASPSYASTFYGYSEFESLFDKYPPADSKQKERVSARKKDLLIWNGDAVTKSVLMDDAESTDLGIDKGRKLYEEWKYERNDKPNLGTLLHLAPSSHTTTLPPSQRAGETEGQLRDRMGRPYTYTTGKNATNRGEATIRGWSDRTPMSREQKPATPEELSRLGSVIVKGTDPQVIEEAAEIILSMDRDKSRSATPERLSGGFRPDGTESEMGRANLEKLKKLAEVYGLSAEKDREGELKKALEGVALKERNKELFQIMEGKQELLSELEQRVATAYRLYSEGKSIESEKHLKEAIALRDLVKKLNPKKAPQVWKQHRGRPTFARVHLGDGNALELVSLNITTTIDGPRARTVVDHVFRNPHARQLEGTFEYPLPTRASPSYYAMFPGKTRDSAPPLFVRQGQASPLTGELLASLKPNEMARAVRSDDWGNLMESRVVNKEKALETYEEVTRRRVDPALLEYAGGNTFSGRVFPIPPNGYSRVLLAYEELLPTIGDKDVYRFALPDCKLNEVVFTLQANAAECQDAEVRTVGQAANVADKEAGFRLAPQGKRLNYERHWTNEGPGGEVRFIFTPPQPRVQVASGRQSENGPLYVYARVRPELKVEKAASVAENAVFLLDTSLSEHPDRFAVSMKLLRKILESDADIRNFNILAFNVGAAWVAPNGWIRNTHSGQQRAFDALDGIVLEGATDLSSALEKLAAAPFIASHPKEPLNVFLLSDGQVTWGESDVNALVSRFESRCPVPTRFHCYRIGLGADNLELFSTLTRRGGGVFNCYSEADLPAVAIAHRHECFTVESVRFVGGPEVSDVLIAGRLAAVYPGGELIVAGRAAETGKTQLVVEGTYLGKKLVQEYPLEITGTGELAARGWGEVAVASLLSLNDPKHDNLVTAYCQQFGIGSRVASFLILENENEYKRFNLEEERGKTLAGDLGKWLEETWQGLGSVKSAKAAFTGFLSRIEPRVKLLGSAQGDHVKKLLDLLGDADYELPAATVNGKLLRKEDVASEYLKARESDPRNVNIYVEEARRRAAKQDVDGAVRALSSIIEEHPGRGDALRLVGYRLLDMRQPGHAARLFEHVERNRPFEPHSYRDLARALEACGKYGLAAVHYEIILAGTWHARFRDSLKQVALEEYVAMMREAIHRRAVTGKLADHFGDRLEKMDASKAQSDLRATISWNTDATDVDLWVIEPDGEKCFYSHNKTKSGGELSQDMTQGYGPERYQTKKAQKGTYRVIVHYYGVNPNLLAGETHVNVTVTKYAGTPQEKTERHTVILKKHGEEVEVCRVEF